MCKSEIKIGNGILAFLHSRILAFLHSCILAFLHSCILSFSHFHSPLTPLPVGCAS